MACAKTCVLLCLCCCCHCCCAAAAAARTTQNCFIYWLHVAYILIIFVCLTVCAHVRVWEREFYIWFALSICFPVSLSPYRGRAVVASVPSICRRCLCVAFLRSTARPNIYNNFFLNGNEGSKFLVVAHSLSLSPALTPPTLSLSMYAINWNWNLQQMAMFDFLQRPNRPNRTEPFPFQRALHFTRRRPAVCSF